MQIRSKISILHQNVVVNQNFVLPDIEEFGLHDRWLSVLWVVSTALSNVSYAADELIQDQIVLNDNSRYS